MTYEVLGLMSGTSLDGLDLCHCSFFWVENHWEYKIHHAETVEYSSFWKDLLSNTTALSAEQLLALDADYGFLLGNRAKNFIGKNNLKNLHLIASHGHTVFHQPKNKFTLQIGDGRAIKIVTQIPTIYDFRQQDVLLGGNGAPLVPIGDHLLFSEYEACINLGGFSNISFIKNQKRIAFDICPVNIILNKLAQNLGEQYDAYGNLARQGTLNLPLLDQLNALEYYELHHPKSLGVEFCKEKIHPALENIDTKNALATITEHAAVQIANVINQNELKSVLCTGGGTYNHYLIEKIRNKTTSQIIIPEDAIIQYKEALIFAFMGLLRWRGENNILCSATGSSTDHSAGTIA